MLAVIILLLFGPACIVSVFLYVILPRLDEPRQPAAHFTDEHDAFRYRRYMEKHHWQWERSLPDA